MTTAIEERNQPAFLTWIRKTTESWWATHGAADFQSYIHGEGDGWRLGTRWTGGYAADQIEAFEATHDLVFPASYRLFLQHLGCIVTRQFASSWADGDLQVEVPEGTSSPFTDWEHQQPEFVEAAFQWVVEGLWFDVEHNGLWLPEWGAKPDTREGQRSYLAALVKTAPRLIPVYGHRFLLTAPAVPQGVVLSIMQSDIVVYGATLPLYLLNELSPVLLQADPAGFAHWTQALSDKAHPDAVYASLPFWGALLR